MDDVSECVVSIDEACADLHKEIMFLFLADQPLGPVEAGRKYIFDDGIRRFGFLQLSVDEFLSTHPELTGKAKIFSRLTDQQKQQRTMGNMMAIVFTVLFYKFPLSHTSRSFL